MATKKSEPRWLNPREMKAWRSYISTVRNVGYRLRELTEAERLQVP